MKEISIETKKQFLTAIGFTLVSYRWDDALVECIFKEIYSQYGCILRLLFKYGYYALAHNLSSINIYQSKSFICVQSVNTTLTLTGGDY